MKKSLLLYTLLIGVFACLIWLVIEKGKTLRAKDETIISINSTLKKQVNTVVNESISEQFLSNINNPLGKFLLQIVVIIVVSRLFGFILVKFGQSSVVGEIIAGIFLGPSIMGSLFPTFSATLFPPDSLKNLQFISQIGLIFFMFLIGMRLDTEKLKNQTQNAVIISHASIVFPFFLGILVSYFLYEELVPSSVSFLAFSLFMGIAMSITAFPVLARIIQERGLTNTPLGAMVITCAAADDVTAWCILAFVVAIAKVGGLISAFLTITLALIFVLMMLFIARPWIQKIAIIENNNLSKKTVVIAFIVLLISAYISEIIGIHALFGAFLAGIIMPRNSQFKELLNEKMEDLSAIIFLPIFFAFTGLKTHIGLLNSSYLWGICSLLLLVAIIGKLGGSAIAAKMVGYSWKDSFSIGVFMNTRGLMALIVLNIGSDLGILSPEIFAIMVIMTVITTIMTAPLLDLIEYFHRKK